MGLDQYLSARRYIGDWEFSDTEERSRYRAIAKAAGVDGWRCAGSPHLYVEMSVAYWRKANQIHKWFVENVQDGNDDCKSYYVSRKQLEELRDICSNDYDAGYIEDLMNTVAQIDAALLRFTEEWRFEYSSSW